MAPCRDRSGSGSLQRFQTSPGRVALSPALPRPPPPAARPALSSGTLSRQGLFSVFRAANPPAEKGRSPRRQEVASGPVRRRELTRDQRQSPDQRPTHAGPSGSHHSFPLSPHRRRLPASYALSPEPTPVVALALQSEGSPSVCHPAYVPNEIGKNSRSWLKPWQSAAADPRVGNRSRTGHAGRA